MGCTADAQDLEVVEGNQRDLSIGVVFEILARMA